MSPRPMYGGNRISHNIVVLVETKENKKDEISHAHQEVLIFQDGKVAFVKL